MVQRSVLLLGAASALAAIALVTWQMASAVPELVSPIAVEEAAVFLDGGTTVVTVVDATGSRFGFGLAGSLGAPGGEHAAYVKRWPALPISLDLEKGGEQERQLAGLAKRAELDNAGHADRTVPMLLAGLREVLERRSKHGQ